MSMRSPSPFDESMRFKESFAKGLVGQHTWILKSPITKMLSYCRTMSAKKAASSEMKFLISSRWPINNQHKVHRLSESEEEGRVIKTLSNILNLDCNT